MENHRRGQSWATTTYRKELIGMTRRQIKRQAKRYAKFVEWSDEDQCFLGRCPGVFAGGVHGDDKATVYRELCETVVEWVELLARPH